MRPNYLYLIIDLACFLATFIFSFHPKIRFNKSWKSFLLANITVAFFFVSWDILFTYWGIWSFNKNYTLPISVLNLPVEEILFFIAIPYSCIFTYSVVKKHYTVKNEVLFKGISVSLIFSLLALGLIFLSKIYTSSTFLLLSLLLLLLQFGIKVKWLPHFYVAFALILVPFFISNGILTGGFTPQAVVNYNDNYNLSIRLYTIPIEDIFYGMLLILLNVALFEYFNREERKKHA